MLMAAGLGTRLRPFTEKTSKPCLPVLGVPVAQFALDTLSQAQVAQVVANLHSHADETEKRFSALDAHQMELKFSDERALLLGSAGGIRKALHHFEGDAFFLLNGDVIAEVNLSELAQKHRELREKRGVTMTLAVHPGAPPGEYTELQCDSSGETLIGFGAKAMGRPFFSGVAVFEPEAFRALPVDRPLELVPAVIQPAIQAGKAGIHRISQGLWYDIGSPELWHWTHLQWIELIESNASFPELWKNRVLSRNHRLAPGVWCASTLAKTKNLQIQARAWKEVAYWGESFLKGGIPPERLGPDAVLYGSRPSASRGIGFEEDWVSIQG